MRLNCNNTFRSYSNLALFSSPSHTPSSAGNIALLLLATLLLPLTHASLLGSTSLPVAAQYAVLPPGSHVGSKAPALAPVLPGRHDFTIRHIFHHGTHNHPDLHRRLDIARDTSVTALQDDGTSTPLGPLSVLSQKVYIQRLVDRSPERLDALLEAGRAAGRPVALDYSAWTVDELSGPNITDKETVLTMAKIAANAYAADNTGVDWEDVKGRFNYTEDFGWQNDGLRGHIFADTENRTIIIGLKGTSPAVFDGSETTTNDKINDNLFFSCCCGQGGQLSWRTVCDCQTSAYKCNSTCVVEALRNKNRYYYAASEIYTNVSQIYPNADIWLTGHSLGGATSALVGLTQGIPVVTFEAPGDAMAASRLGLPTPPGYNYGYHQQRDFTGGYQFGHSADPIFMGTCNTLSSVCTIAGYAMQSQCHSGMTCTYDTVKDFGWRSGAGNHRVKVVIHDVIDKYPKPAECHPMKNCTDCYNWEYFESHKGPVTSTKISKTSTSYTSTRTSTCKTPGWWGCLDETTTTSRSATTTTAPLTTTTTTTTTTRTCLTPGWFGCNDHTTAISTTTTTSADPSSTIIPPTLTKTVTLTTTEYPSKPSDPTPPDDPWVSSTRSSVTTSCATPGWFGCKDSTPTGPNTETLALPTASGQPSNRDSVPRKALKTCSGRTWYGRCKEWRTIITQDPKLDL